MTSPQVGAVEFKVPNRIVEASTYVPDWSGLNRSEFICLDRNENTHPLPTLVHQALVQAIERGAVQAYPEAQALVEPLARYAGINPAYLLLTNGSDQGIDLCLRALLGEGDVMVTARPEFPVFTQVASTIGARITPVLYKPDLSFPYADFTAALKAYRPAAIVLINPNNPTGTSIDLDYIVNVVTTYPNIPVIVDEAYYEYTGQTVLPLVKAYPNLIVLRTFSKAFAMAGLRLGYIVAAPSLLVHIRKLQNPFDVNHLAIVAGIAQLARVDEARAECQYVMEHIKPYVIRALRRLGVPVWAGSANFVLVRPPDCARAVAFLRDAGVLVRRMSGELLAGTFRMSVGTMPQMQHFVSIFRSYLRE
jgi:histidinol-phosphate aminotransferase